MRPHESAHDLDRMLPLQFRHHRKLFQLGRRIKSIAAFPFDCGHAETKHRIKSPKASLQQLGRRGLPGGANTIDDAAASLHDIHVSIAAQPPGEFFGPVAGKQEMGMRVDKTWQNAAASRVDLFIGFDSQSREDFAGRANLPDDSILQP